MLANSICEVWHDFKHQVIDPKGFSPETVDFIRHVFYCSYNACLLEVFALPHRCNDDHAKVAKGLADMLKEAEDYFRNKGIDPVLAVSRELDS